MGLQFAVSVGLMVGLGYYLDDRLEVLPLFTLLGLVIGFTAGLWSLYREVFGDDDGNRRP